MIGCTFASACWCTRNLMMPDRNDPVVVLMSFKDQRTSTSFLHGSHHDYVLVYLDSEK
jgi:hypothetical protein